MKKGIPILVLFLGVMLTFGSVVHAIEEIPDRPILLLKVNEELEKRTVIKPSTIPNAGNGLFAVVRIRKGEVIGELGGRFVPEEEDTSGNHYIAGILECAWKETYPYTGLDAREFGGRSRINFAPSKINGIRYPLPERGDPAALHVSLFCLFCFARHRAGRGNLASYGPSYDYDRFMNERDVRAFFCGLLNMDCSEEYRYEH